MPVSCCPRESESIVCRCEGMHQLQAWKNLTIPQHREQRLELINICHDTRWPDRVEPWEELDVSEIVGDIEQRFKPGRYANI